MFWGRLFFFTLIALSLVSSAIAESQRPAPRGGERSQPQSQPKQTQQTAAPDQRGTEQSPLTVKVIPTPKSTEETARDAKERDEKLELDRKLVELNGDLTYWTKILGIVAGLQFVALFIQAVFLAATAKLARTSLRDIERAWLTSGPNSDHTELLPDGKARIYLSVLNIGGYAADRCARQYEKYADHCSKTPESLSAL